MRVSIFQLVGLGSCFMLFISLSSCKKDKVTPAPATTTTSQTTTVTPPGSGVDLIRDSIFLYAKDVYFWNDAIPDYTTFNPRQYTSLSTDLGNFQKELFDIAHFKINPQTSNPYENYDPAPTLYCKYSHMELKESSTGQAGAAPVTINSVNTNGVGNDYGFDFNGALPTKGSPTYNMYILYVNSASPAFKAGLSRGDIIKKVNGTTLSDPATFSADAVLLDNALSQSTVTLECIKKSGATVTLNLSSAKYTTNPVLKDSVYTSGAKKIGYISYAIFSTLENSSAALQNSFARFSSAGVTDLVVDLRYNGGGLTNTAELLCNLIAPSSISGSVMYTRNYNVLMQAGNAKMLINQPYLDGNGKQVISNGKLATYYNVDYTVASNTLTFSKVGNNTALKKVVFLVSSNTASASELVINSLRPYMDVKLVGSKTYGKPIAFFPLYVGKYEIYYSMFNTKNSTGYGDYYSGFDVDYSASDNFNLDFGNTGDNALKAALSYIVNGDFTSGTTVSKAGNTAFQVFDEKLMNSNRNNFKGMIVNDFKLKN